MTGKTNYEWLYKTFVTVCLGATVSMLGWIVLQTIDNGKLLVKHEEKFQENTVWKEGKNHKDDDQDKQIVYLIKHDAIRTNETKEEEEE